MIQDTARPRAHGVSIKRMSAPIIRHLLGALSHTQSWQIANRLIDGHHRLKESTFQGQRVESHRASATKVRPPDCVVRGQRVKRSVTFPRSEDNNPPSLLRNTIVGS